MAQLLVVGANLAKRKVERGIRKTEAEDHAVQAVDDIISVFPDTHNFSPTEKDIFGIIQVHGTVEEVWRWLPMAEKREDAEGDEEWKNPDDGQWYKLKTPKKFEVNISSLSESDLNAIKSSMTSKEDREAAYAKMTNKIKADPTNTSELVSG